MIWKLTKGKGTARGVTPWPPVTGTIEVINQLTYGAHLVSLGNSHGTVYNVGVCQSGGQWN